MIVVLIVIKKLFFYADYYEHCTQQDCSLMAINNYYKNYIYI